MTRWWDVILGSITLLLVSLSLALLFHSTDDKPVPILTEYQAPLPEGVQLISAEEGMQLGRQALFVDARERVAYDEAHIAGAISMPYGEPLSESVLARLLKARLLVLYCDGPDCKASTRLAAELRRLGVRDMRVLKEGYPGWRDRGFPVTQPRRVD